MAEEVRPLRLAGLNWGGSVELFASITMRPPKSGNPASAAGTRGQLTAMSTMSLAAASSRVPALMAGPMAAAVSRRLSGPRLFERVAPMPFLASALAKAWPILPAPMIPMHALAEQFAPDASIVIIGGMARDWPYPGSTTITMANGAVTSMVRALAVELAPVRVNAVHPGAVGDSPAVSEAPPALVEAARAQTPTGRLATMDNVAAAALALLDNPGINGVNLPVDGGFLLK
jgi:NAD(P)-dependent dehydrogenase (short-subunit alcohol dehydrogenase family)